MSKPSNPFNPNSIVTPTLFAGRKQQVLNVLKKLSDVREGQHASFILHGERGIGKTALAKLIRHTSSSKNSKLFNLNFATSYYSVEKGQSLKTVMESSLNNITEVLPDSSIKKLRDRLGGLFKQGKFAFGAFGMNVNLDVKKTKEGKQFFKDQVVSSLTNLIQSSVGNDKNDKFDGLLIVIDEIHNIQDLEGAGQIFRSIISTLDVSEKGFFSFLLIGYSDSIDKFFKGDPSARRSFDLLHLDVMPDKEAKELLTKGFNEIKGLKYNESGLDKHITVAGGYPHSLQILGHQIIEIDNDNNISNEDWSKAIINSTKELQNKDFSHLYSFSGKPTLREEIMNHLALANGDVITKTSLGKNFSGKNIYHRTALPQLIQKGAVKEDVNSGKLSLHSELFKSAIRFHLKSLEKN